MVSSAKGQRQTAWASLDVALVSLAETSAIVLATAVSLEHRLLNHLTPVESATKGSSGIKQNPPLLGEIEERIRFSLGQLREAQDIYAGIERELSA